MALLESLGDACEVHEPDDRDLVDGVAPQVVARPGSAEETSALLQACHRDSLAVVARGHGSKLSWGRSPERLDVVLDTTAMAELVEHSRGDLIATAGAGMPLATLQERLAEGGHQLMVDDPVGAAVGSAGTGAGSTLGGAVATGMSGPRRMLAGPLRDLVIGVRLVRADGTVAKAGGKVVKNVAGYDLAKLLTGSYGTLAVLTEVTVRLHPVPETSLWVHCDVTAQQLAPVLAHVVHSQLVPHAVEITASPDAPARVGVLLTGTDAGAQARAGALAQELQDLTRSTAGVDGTPPPGPAVGAGQTVLRTTARLSGIPDLVAHALSHGLDVTGSAGTGVLHATAATDADPVTVGAAVDAVRAESVRLGGSTVVLDAPAAVKSAVDTWGPVPGLDLMRAVKREFDPTRILAPGRFVGGL